MSLIVIGDAWQDCGEETITLAESDGEETTSIVHVWLKGMLKVFVAVEEGAWHLSISHPSRYPTWDEIKEARYRLLPDEIYMAMILPPSGEYVNVHENCFHLWEVPPEVVR